MAARTCSLLLLALVTGCGDPDPGRVRPEGHDGSLGRGVEASADAPPDILVVTVDTLRADFTSPYGHPSDPTPELGKLAEAGVTFTHHYSVMSHTVPSHASIFCGLHPRVHGTRKNGHPVPQDVELLAESLQEAGYRTAGVVAVTFLGKTAGLDQGIESINEDFTNSQQSKRGGSGFYRRDATDVIDHAIAELGQGDGRPRFLWVHLYDPHYPYEAPAEFQLTDVERELYADRAGVSNLYEADKLVQRAGDYEAEVRYTDHEIGRLLSVWDSHERGRNGIVVVTADHGEGLGEHNLLGHGLWNYEEQLLVPLVIRMPGKVPAGSVVEGRTSQVDIAATICELADLETGLGGSSLMPLVRGEEEPNQRTILSERRLFTDEDWARRADLLKLMDQLAGMPGVGQGDQLAVIQGEYKYIWSEVASDELYHLVDDPDESKVLLDSEPDRASQMLNFLEGYRARTASTASAIEASAPVIDEETMRALRALGY